jgi:hypothetical protein
MKLKEPEQTTPESSSSSSDLEAGILALEIKDLIRSVHTPQSYKILLLGITKGASEATGLLSPIDVLQTIKTSLIRLSEFEKKLHNDEED